MNRARFAEGQDLFKEGDPADSVFRLLSGAVDILRDLDGDPILLGTIGAGQFVGEMGVVENRPRNATARAASEVEVEILTPNEFFDQIAGSPRVVRELIQRLSRRLREADDRIVNDERRSGEPRETSKDADSQTALELVKNAYLSAKNPWLRTQLHELVGLGDLPFVVGRGPVAGEGRRRRRELRRTDGGVVHQVRVRRWGRSRIRCCSSVRFWIANLIYPRNWSIGPAF